MYLVVMIHKVGTYLNDTYISVFDLCIFLIDFQVMSISRGLNPQIKLGAQTATIPGSAVKRSIQGILG